MAMLLVKNRKALFDYSLVEKYTAGIVLTGAQARAIREGNVNFEGSFVKIVDGQAFITGMFIGPYSKQGKTYDETKASENRKLLIKASEIKEIASELSQKGKTAVPMALVLDHNLIKLEFAVVKGRKEFEKKVVAKEKQIKKDLERDSKEFRRLVP
jgi:SsrA-binding protein